MSKAIDITARAAIGNARSGHCSAAKLLAKDLVRIPKRSKSDKSVAKSARVIVGHLCGKSGLGYVARPAGSPQYAWKVGKRRRR